MRTSILTAPQDYVPLTSPSTTGLCCPGRNHRRENPVSNYEALCRLGKAERRAVVAYNHRAVLVARDSQSSPRLRHRSHTIH